MELSHDVQRKYDLLSTEPFQSPLTASTSFILSVIRPTGSEGFKDLRNDTPAQFCISLRQISAQP